MFCFRFTRSAKDGSPVTKSPSTRSNSSNSTTDHDVRGSASDCFSQISSESFQKSALSICHKGNNLRIFTIQELKNATRNFNRALILGEGGFGCVYKGTIKSVLDPRRSLDVAVKQLGRKGLQGHKEWLTEINLLGVVDHPNLVKLIGYCCEDDERGTQLLLVYEFMPNGSLADYLSAKSSKPLSWDMRLRVAVDTARGLRYLHEQSEIKIIFRDLKPSNILLDPNWNAKLSDFGLARLGPQEGSSHVSTAVVGTLGYAAPEYIHTGRLTTRNDVWSYGIVLYELITGRRPMDRNRPKGEQSLLEWIRPYAADIKKFPEIVDPRLNGDFSIRAVLKLAAVANKCLGRHPKSRPKMSEVLEMVQRIADHTEPGTPEYPMRSSTEEQPAKQSKPETRRTIQEARPAEGRRLQWHGWAPKLVKTH